MNYDRAMRLCSLDAGSPLLKKLSPVRICLYAQLQVYHGRYWEAVQAGSKIDKLVQLPRLPGDDISATQYCILEDEHVYRIEQVQEGVDDVGLAVFTLSLSRREEKYDIGKP